MFLSDLQLGPVEWVVLVFIGLFLVTRLPWWLGKVCVPSPVFSERVRADAPVWRAKAASWITGFPSVVDAKSFLATAFWPAIFGLNLVLLAQSLEMFMPGAGRVEVPYLGSYTWLSLLAAVLYSVSQTVFAVFAGESGKKSISAIFLLMVFVSIGVEMSLAGYRSWLIITSQVEVDQTAADAILSKGVAITMFISFIVSMAHTALGFVSLPKFIFPLVNYAPKLLGGIIFWFASWFTVFFFGFHPGYNVPLAISGLREDAASLKRNVLESLNKCKLLLKALTELLVPFSELQAEVRSLVPAAHSVRSAWKQKSLDIGPKIASLPENKAEAKVILTSAIDDLKELKSTVDRHVREQVERGERLCSKLKKLPDASAEAMKTYEEVKTLIKILPDQGNQMLDRLRGLVAKVDSYLKVILVGIEVGAIPDHNDRELDELRQASINAKLRTERARVNKILHLSTTILGKTKEELLGLQISLAELEHAFVVLREKSAAAVAPPPPPPATVVDDERGRTQAGMADLIAAGAEVGEAITALMRELTKMKLRIEKGLSAKPKKQGFFSRFFGAIWGFFNGILEAIMNSGKEGKEPGKQDVKPMEQPEPNFAEAKPNYSQPKTYAPSAGFGESVRDAGNIPTDMSNQSSVEIVQRGNFQ